MDCLEKEKLIIKELRNRGIILDADCIYTIHEDGPNSWRVGIDDMVDIEKGVVVDLKSKKELAHCPEHDIYFSLGDDKDRECPWCNLELALMDNMD